MMSKATKREWKRYAKMKGVWIRPKCPRCGGAETLRTIRTTRFDSLIERHCICTLCDFRVVVSSRNVASKTYPEETFQDAASD